MMWKSVQCYWCGHRLDIPRLVTGRIAHVLHVDGHILQIRTNSIQIDCVTTDAKFRVHNDAPGSPGGLPGRRVPENMRGPFELQLRKRL